MRISDIRPKKIEEDASAGATGAAGIATVAMPLFGSKKMIRRAVDPNGYMFGKKKRKVEEKMDKASSNAMPSLMDIGNNSSDLNKWGKAVAGHDGKKQTAPKSASPNAGVFKDHGYAIGYSKADRAMASKAIGKKTKMLTGPGSKEAAGTNTKSTIHGDLRESELFADNVIYKLDPTNPMDDSEILVIGGGGRYSFKGLRNKARQEAAQLAKDLQADSGHDFRKSARNIEQLNNTLKTIVAAYNQLNDIRAKGGKSSRGIRNEDSALIKECAHMIGQWSIKFNKVKP